MVVATSAFKVGFGYRVVLPVAAYFTWNGTNPEGRGLVPDIEEQLSPEAVWSGEDNQIKSGHDAVRCPVCLEETLVGTGGTSLRNRVKH